tara:strand:- start:326 stop:1573 length:1248 start_codon:yes stop_codon:yes gene_type:complete
MTTPKTTFVQEIKSLSRPIWILSGGVFIDRFGMFVVPFLVLFLTSNGVNKEIAGIAIGAFGLGSLAGAGLGGYLADRIGRRRTMGISMFGSGAFTLLTYAFSLYLTKTGAVWPLCLVTACYGTVRGFYHAASSSLVADLVPSESRVAAFAVLRFAINFGWALGMTAAGFLAEIGFVWLFVIDAATSWIFGIVTVTCLPAGEKTEKEQSGWIPAFRNIVHDRQFLALCLNTLILATIYNQWNTSFAVLIQDRGHSAKLFGLIMALNGILIVLFEMPLSALGRRFTPALMIGLGTAVAGLGFGINAWMTTGLGFAFAMTVFTIGEMVSLPIQGAYVSDLAPEKMRGRYNGMMGVMWSGANIVAPTFGLALLGVSAEVLCFTVMGLGVAGALLLNVRKPAKFRRSAPVPAVSSGKEIR